MKALITAAEVRTLCKAGNKVLTVKPGDIVTLSPACSSFDFFKNFEERGNTFRAIVESLH